MAWTATRWDLARFGLAAEACTIAARAVTVADVASCTFHLPGHGFAGGEQLELEACGTGSVLPTGTSPISAYLAKLLSSGSSRLFTITNLDGSEVVITDAGVGLFNVLVDAGPLVDAIMAAETSLVIARAKAYRGPWTTPPAWAPALVADLAAYRVAKLLRTSSPQYSLADLATFRAQALETLKQLDKGEPMDDGVGPVDATPAVLEAGATSAPIRPGPFGAPIRIAQLGGVNLTPDDGFPLGAPFGGGDRV